VLFLITKNFCRLALGQNLRVQLGFMSRRLVAVVVVGQVELLIANLVAVVVGFLRKCFSRLCVEVLKPSPLVPEV